MPDNFDAGLDPHFGFTRRHFLQLLLLVSAVPVQYFITSSSTETDRAYQLHNVLTGLSQLKTKYFNITFWTKLCTNLWKNGTIVEERSDHEAPVTEKVPETSGTEETGYYGTSLTVRNPRPPAVRYRVGQVIRHNLWNYRGVIIGWDERANAPEWWLDEMHPKDKPEWKDMPNYAVLVDTRDRLTPQMTYVVQDNIEVISDVSIFNPLVDSYFEHFDGTEYVPRPWMKAVYPYG